ncbi:MAG: hypothetical protein V4549_08175 [Bacteroidota bacterium]
MRRYFDNAVIFDTLFCILLGLCLYLSKVYIKQYFSTPSAEGINKLADCLITIGTTLIGILLTIITVIVTFKKGFEDKTGIPEKPVPTDFSEIPTQTVFDKTVTKETQFYGSDIHKKVADVFISATYETGIVLLILLVIKTELFMFKDYLISILTFLCLLLIVSASLRSFFIFRLFLNVHLHEKKG